MEKEKSSNFHHSFIEKKEQLTKKYESSLKEFKETSNATEKQLKKIQQKMNKSEMLSNKAKQERSKVAHYVIEKLEAITTKKSQEKPDKKSITKILKKYQTIKELAKKKHEDNVESWKQKKNEYLEHLQQLAELRSKSEILEEEKKAVIMKKRAEKEDKINIAKKNAWKERKYKIKSQKLKENEIKEKLEALKKEKVLLNLFNIKK